MVGTKCYNEAVFYRVDKHEGLDSLNEAPIQSFYFSNLGDAKELEYVDTQVKYGKTYTYRIYAMNLIVGSSYNYERLKSDIGLTRMKVTTRPSLQIMEVPIFKKSVIVLDNPPIAPDVDIIPFRGINNKVRIALNSGIGRYDLQPEIIQYLEQQLIDDR